jgi:nuclear transport factor 2 (NTF2) superfamily protein
MQDFAARYTAAWCSQDPARVAAFFSANGSLRVNDDSPAVGRTAIAGVAQGFMSAFPDLELIMDGVEVQGDRAVYRWTLAGTHSGTGRRVRISGFEQWRIAEDGLIAESQGHFDSEDYRRQLLPITP